MTATIKRRKRQKFD